MNGGAVGTRVRPPGTALRGHGARGTAYSSSPISAVRKLERLMDEPAPAGRTLSGGGRGFGVAAPPGLEQSRHVQDRRDLAVAQDGETGDGGQPVEEPARRPDDDLGPPGEAVHGETDALVPCSTTMTTSVDGGSPATREERAQAHVGKGAALQAEHALGRLAGHVGGRSRQRTTPDIGNHERQAAHPSQQPFDDREGQRHADAELRALPGRLSTSTEPPRASTCLRTTSRPTPRPEAPDTWRAVERAALKISRSISPSVGGGPRPPGPAHARGRGSARDRGPAPSSSISSTMSLPSCRARSSTRAVASLPARTRASGASRPWSTALRTRCVSGALSCSMTELSTSTPWSETTSSTCFSLADRQVAHGPAMAAEQRPDRHHAHPAHGAVQARQQPLQRAIGVREPGGPLLLDREAQAAARDRDLAGGAEQVVEPVHVDPKRRAASALGVQVVLDCGRAR